MDIEDFEKASQACVAALEEAVDRDWTVAAGSLTWSCWQTADHLVDVIFSYAFQIAARPEKSDLAFDELRAAPEAPASHLVNGLLAVSRMMTSTMRSSPSGVTIPWHGQPIDLRSWAAMGTREIILHTHDIATGLGVPYAPEADLAAAVLAFAHPDADPGHDPWASLVRASGRPFGQEETAVRAAATEERRSRLSPPGAVEGLVSNFESGEVISSFGSGWLASSDRLQGGSSTADIAVVDGGAAGTNRSLRVAGELVEGPGFQWAGALFSPGPAPMATANLWGKRFIRFWAMGDGRTCLLWSLAETGGGRPAGASHFRAGPDWRPYEFELRNMGTDGSDLSGLMFVAWRPTGPFSFQIDEVRID